MKKYTIISDSKLSVSDKVTPLRGTKDVSVVIPSYNEEGNVVRLIEGITKAIGKEYSFEVVIVDDASTDRTKEVLSRKALKDKNVVAVFREGIRGIWSAQLDGVRLSRGKSIIFMDADFSHPPEKIPDLLKWIPEYDFVSASRYIKGGGMKNVPFKHHIATIMFNMGMKLIMGLTATDYTGVFHAIKKDKLMRILPKSDSVGGAFDLDLLYYAKKRRLKFKEVPFVYVYRMQGKSKSRKMRQLAFIYGIRALRLRLFGRA